MIDTTTLNKDFIIEYTSNFVREDSAVTPKEYFEFAQMDRSDGTTGRHLVNSVSNSKRALHLRVENLYNAFGGMAVAGKPRNFPELVGFLRKCGIASPRILDRINKLRNATEHGYYVPTVEEVDTFLDVTELFLCATDMLLSRQPCSISFWSADVRDNSGRLSLVEMSFEWQLGEIELSFISEGSRELKGVVQRMDFKAPEYFDCVRFAVKYND